MYYNNKPLYSIKSKKNKALNFNLDSLFDFSISLSLKPKNQIPKPNEKEHIVSIICTKNNKNSCTQQLYELLYMGTVYKPSE
jgi:hypothetical protein